MIIVGVKSLLIYIRSSPIRLTNTNVSVEDVRFKVDSVRGLRHGNRVILLLSPVLSNTLLFPWSFNFHLKSFSFVSLKGDLTFCLTPNPLR